MNSFVSYLRNVRAELTHVVWPNPRIAAWHVVLIIVISAFTAALVAGLDYGFTQGVGYLISR
jgi:preprotein translocase subunit SecE